MYGVNCADGTSAEIDGLGGVHTEYLAAFELISNLCQLSLLPIGLAHERELVRNGRKSDSDLDTGAHGSGDAIGRV